MAQNVIHEMRYEKGSSRYRILSLYEQDPNKEKPGFSIRTGQAAKGSMDTEKYLKMFGVHVDLFSPLTNERWKHDLSKEKAASIVKQWRKSCDQAGLVKALSFDQDYRVMTHTEEEE